MQKVSLIDVSRLESLRLNCPMHAIGRRSIWCEGIEDNDKSHAYIG
jgi:hypothetical protein